MKVMWLVRMVVVVSVSIGIFMLDRGTVRHRDTITSSHRRQRRVVIWWLLEVRIISGISHSLTGMLGATMGVDMCRSMSVMISVIGI